MARHIAKRLTERDIREAGPGKHCDGDGLWLEVKPTGARRWFFRYTMGQTRREYGIGPYGAHPKVSTDAARAEAAILREKIRQGIDPLAPEPAPPSEPAPPAVPTFTAAAARFIRQHRHAWSNAKHGRQWVATLKTYARPVIGHIPVDQITTAHLLAILSPIWVSRTETAKRVQGRIERILDAATAQGHRTGDNPARWRGHLSSLLPPPRKVTRVRHQPALAWEAVPGFILELRTHQGLSAKALEWLIRTATRTGETLGATWSEIDRATMTWTIPEGRMKSRREHVIPLTPACIAILDSLPRLARSDYLFPSVNRTGAHLSPMAILMLMRGMGHGVGGDKTDSVPHGFRSSFRQWAGEATPHPREVIEHCLAHAVEDATERAYQRGTLLLKRRAVMQDWSDFLDKAPAQVVTLHPTAAPEAAPEVQTATASRA